MASGALRLQPHAPAVNADYWRRTAGVPNLAPLSRLYERIAAGALALALSSDCRSSSHERANPGLEGGEAAALRWWHSLEACKRSLERDPPKRQLGRARLGSFNVRWFPDGEAGTERQEPGTDVEWLACAIARLEIDLLAVQEFKSHPATAGAFGQLVEALTRFAGGRWKMELDGCGQRSDGHVGFVWNEDRVRARDLREATELLAGRRCDADWRPGLSAHFRFQGGFDAHVIALHAVAGHNPERLRDRTRIFAEISRAVRESQRRRADDDVIVLGDFNVSGCSECEPEISQRAELARLALALENATPPLRFVPSTVACTQFQGDGPFLLDLFAVSRRLQELPPDARVEVEGYCSESACRRSYEPPEVVYERVSDHCPIVLSFTDRDLD